MQISKSPYMFTAPKMKFSIKDFSSKCDQIRRFLRIWPHLLKKSLMENFIFCAVVSVVDINQKTTYSRHKYNINNFGIKISGISSRLVELKIFFY